MKSKLTKTLLLIGVGRLGYRHLQGLLALKGENIIYILDLSVKSIEVARENIKETSNNHIIYFLTAWDELPKDFDLVIVATSADVRELIVTRLLHEYKVGYLILEKVLFQQLESYKRMEELIKQKKVLAWVNHTRRMMEPYKIIKNIILKSNEIVSFYVFGGNWGLACNGLHFIDLCMYLTDSSVKTIDGDWVDNIIHESKRPNFIEFTGTIKGTFINNTNFIISSLEGEQEPATIYISTKSNRWIVQESNIIKVINLSKNNKFDEVISSYNMELVSNLTTKIVQDIFESGKCDLPTYIEASQSHIPFINTLLQKYNDLTGIEGETCPIT